MIQPCPIPASSGVVKDTTRAELAERLGVTESRISAIESRTMKAPPPDQICEIESVLGFAQGQILDEASMIEGP